MITVHLLLFFVMYFIHCFMAQNLLTYYMVKPYPFHWNLFRWNQDVRIAFGELD
jgi:hypothetical protein